jgi:hypothetical protein
MSEKITGRDDLNIAEKLFMGNLFDSVGNADQKTSEAGVPGASKMKKHTRRQQR